MDALKGMGAAGVAACTAGVSAVCMSPMSYTFPPLIHPLTPPFPRISNLHTPYRCREDAPAGLRRCWRKELQQARSIRCALCPVFCHMCHVMSSVVWPAYAKYTHMCVSMYASEPCMSYTLHLCRHVLTNLSSSSSSSSSSSPPPPPPLPPPAPSGRASALPGSERRPIRHCGE